MLIKYLFIINNIFNQINKINIIMQPKPFLDNFKLRHQAIGKERRLNMTKIILEKAPNFPLAVELKDIDQEVERWVNDELDISFDGKRLPTFKLFSNQRINEYAQNWNHLDESGNLLMNFKLITRENNPKHGENQGSYYNIPGNRFYPMFMVPVLQENGLQAYDMYSMKQPYCVDLIYSLIVITNKYELINEMNMLIHDKFKAINCYIAPNGHFMPMSLEDVSDDSEYTIDDRKYYAQGYSIKLKAYIIREEDYKVTRLPSRVKVRMLGTNEKLKSKQRKPTIQVIDDYDWKDNCPKPQDETVYKRVTVNVNFPECTEISDFIIDEDITIESIETTNVYDFVLYINGELINVEEDDIVFINGDKIHLEISRNKELLDSIVAFVGFNPNEILDINHDSLESSALDKPDEEIIDVNN